MNAVPDTQDDVPPYALSVAAVLSQLGSDSDQGLLEERVAELRARYGYNELGETPGPTVWRLFLGQFNEVVVWILLAAAVLSGLVREWADAGAILAIVMLNALLGVAQERRAEQALAALRKLAAPATRVVRGGQLRSLPARDLVPGDRVELEAGDHVPADARLLAAVGLRVQEAALTGESEPAEKDHNAALEPVTALADRRNMVYAGTVVAAGKASAVVVGTAMQTELGQIAGLLQHHAPEPTPLQRRLTELGRVLAVACLAVAGVVFIIEALRGRALAEVTLLAVSLAVAAVPEGLPAVVTVALTVGLQRMARRNALVRKLPSVETLGSVTVICSDKTGTLTRNEMTVREFVAGGRRYQLTGGGFDPRGEFLDAEEPGRTVDAVGLPDLSLALSVGAFCNNARVTPRGKRGTWQVIGDPTEGALLVAALKGRIEVNRSAQPVVHEIPFDSERKAMSVVVRTPQASFVMYTKGAPEVILGKCGAERRAGLVEAMTEERKVHVRQTVEEMAARALRVLALAYREYPPGAPSTFEESGLTFVGLVGMMDPPREEAREAVMRCQEAGIRPVMITGDHPVTALAVARELGIAHVNDAVLTGADLERMSEEQLAARVENAPVYARVTAEHKLRVVQAWKRRGHVVAMTGDGVNDAPAVKAADIGIAMSITGTDVTKEASAMVLTDDNFASIVSAVEEGRGIYDNIQKFLLYLLAGNAGLVLFVLLASLFGWPFPLTATQILWMNLVTNGLPALALGVEPPDPDVMRRRPRPPGEPILSARAGLLTLAVGLLVAVVTAVGFGLVYHEEEANLPRARTMAFCVVSYAFIFSSFAFRNPRRTMPELGFFSNPALLGAVAVSCLLQLSVITLPFARPVFETAGHFAWEWVLLGLLTLAPVTVIEVIKLIRGRLLSSLPRLEEQAGARREIDPA